MLLGAYWIYCNVPFQIIQENQFVVSALNTPPSGEMCSVEVISSTQWSRALAKAAAGAFFASKWISWIRTWWHLFWSVGGFKSQELLGCDFSIALNSNKELFFFSPVQSGLGMYQLLVQG